MKIHYQKQNGDETFINNVVHLQNVDDNIFEALLENGKTLTLQVTGIEGIADSSLYEKRDKTK